MNKYNSVAIDGPAGSGKSSIAKIIANKINYTYINTGIMYRSIAYLINLYKLDINDSIKIIKEFKKNKINFINEDKVLYMNKNIYNDLRCEKISLLTSIIAKNKNIRSFLVNQQQKLALNNNVVMDGRDIASVVLPNAIVKIYLWASADVRANRRVKQNTSLGIDSEYNQILSEIKQRDYIDQNRKISPLICTKDAIKIDTSNMSIVEVVNKIINIINDRV